MGESILIQTNFFIERLKICSKILVQRSGVLKNVSNSFSTPRIQFNVLSRTIYVKMQRKVIL